MDLSFLDFDALIRSAQKGTWRPARRRDEMPAVAADSTGADMRNILSRNSARLFGLGLS